MLNEEKIPNGERDAIMLEAYNKTRDLLNYVRKNTPAGYHREQAMKKLNQFITLMEPLERLEWSRKKAPQAKTEVI